MKKAYDMTKNATLIQAMRRQNVPDVITAACLREVLATSCSFVLDNHTRSAPVLRERSLLQGDPAAPRRLNIAVDFAASEFIGLCRRNRWGIWLPNDLGWNGRQDRLDNHIALILFSDTFWLFATTSNMLEQMMKAWLQILYKHGWSVPIGETCWCTTKENAETYKITVEGQTIERRNREEGFKALGSIIQFNNRCSLDLEARMAAMRRCFAKYYNILGCRSCESMSVSNSWICWRAKPCFDAVRPGTLPRRRYPT
eukprot:TRINITY_DN47719_c0_g1_i2.p1 TRINITY_DN47719_c0_g1~~TRINITY_DN47719_c0_g1_i2.p1  ORF type:complete len:256 (+),score=18.25 TRINITY_DN47719_c0_g1_i2:251-1018(+)